MVILSNENRGDIVAALQEAAHSRTIQSKELRTTYDDIRAGGGENGHAFLRVSEMLNTRGDRMSSLAKLLDQADEIEVTLAD